MPREIFENSGPKVEAHPVSKTTIETPRKHTPRTKAQNDKKITDKELTKENKKLMLLGNEKGELSLILA